MLPDDLPDSINGGDNPPPVPGDMEPPPAELQLDEPPPPPQEPELIHIQLHKVNGSMGLSIVAARVSAISQPIRRLLFGLVFLIVSI